MDGVQDDVAVGFGAQSLLKDIRATSGASRVSSTGA
jgi:hypothetical protein